MTWTTEGIYRHGAIELLQTPEGVQEGRVIVTVTQAESAKPKALLKRGKYQSGRLSTEADFEQAEWRGEKEFDGD